MLLFDFSFLPFIEDHLFSCAQIIILFEKFRVPVFFFQNFIPKLGNPSHFFICIYYKKLQFFKSNKAFAQSLINLIFSNYIILHFIFFQNKA